MSSTGFLEQVAHHLRVRARFLFSEVWETNRGVFFLDNSWGAWLGTVAVLWVDRFAPGATERPLLTTVVAAFGTLMAVAVWWLTYMECVEWLAPWEVSDERERKPMTTPWRMGTSMFAVVGSLILFYFGPSAAIASLRRGYSRNPSIAPKSLPVAGGDPVAFWLFFALIVAAMFLQKAFALMDPAVVEKRFSRHRMVKYAFVFAIAVAALAAQTWSLPGLAFSFMPALLFWYGRTSGPLEKLTNERPHLRGAFPRLLWICISRLVGWLVFWEGILYVVLVYLPTPLGV